MRLGFRGTRKFGCVEVFDCIEVAVGVVILEMSSDIKLTIVKRTEVEEFGRMLSLYFH